MSAKPVIDISLALTTLIPRETYAEPLRALGYRHNVDPWNDDHEYFGRDSTHVHVCQAVEEFETRHLAFRDWLRTHDDDAAAYADLKRSLAEAHPRDIVSYVEGKTDFIAAIEARALAEGVGKRD